MEHQLWRVWGKWCLKAFHNGDQIVCRRRICIIVQLAVLTSCKISEREAFCPEAIVAENRRCHAAPSQNRIRRQSIIWLQGARAPWEAACAANSSLRIVARRGTSPADAGILTAPIVLYLPATCIIINKAGQCRAGADISIPGASASIQNSNRTYLAAAVAAHGRRPRTGQQASGKHC